MRQNSAPDIVFTKACYSSICDNTDEVTPPLICKLQEGYLSSLNVSLKSLGKYLEAKGVPRMFPPMCHIRATYTYNFCLISFEVVSNNN